MRSPVRPTRSPIGHLPPVPRTPVDDYYTRLRAGAALDLPEGLEAVLSAVLTLQPADRRRLANAGYWLQHSDFVAKYSAPASYAALITAVEALIDKSAGGSATVPFQNQTARRVSASKNAAVFPPRSDARREAMRRSSAVSRSNDRPRRTRVRQRSRARRAPSR